MSEERKKAQFARPGHVSFDERSLTLATLVIKSLVRLGQSGYDVVDQLATSTARGEDNDVSPEKGLQGALTLRHLGHRPGDVSRPAHRFKLALRDR